MLCVQVGLTQELQHLLPSTCTNSPPRLVESPVFATRLLDQQQLVLMRVATMSRVFSLQPLKQNMPLHTFLRMTPIPKTGKRTERECIGEMQTGRASERSTAGTLEQMRCAGTGHRLVSQIRTINYELTQLTHIAFGPTRMMESFKRTTHIPVQQVTVQYHHPLPSSKLVSPFLEWLVRPPTQFKSGELSRSLLRAHIHLQLSQLKMPELQLPVG